MFWYTNYYKYIKRYIHAHIFLTLLLHISNVYRATLNFNMKYINVAFPDLMPAELFFSTVVNCFSLFFLLVSVRQLKNEIIQMGVIIGSRVTNIPAELINNSQRNINKQ